MTSKSKFMVKTALSQLSIFNLPIFQFSSLSSLISQGHQNLRNSESKNETSPNLFQEDGSSFQVLPPMDKIPDYDNIQVISPDFDKMRLDRWLSIKFPNIGRGKLFKFIRTGKIKVIRQDIADNPTSEADFFISSTQIVPKVPSFRLLESDQITLDPRIFHNFSELETQFNETNTVDRDLTRSLNASSELDVESLILYKDSDLIFLNKPSGMPVQGGTNQKRFLTKFLRQLTFDASESPRLVHRLDKGTSGVMILARHRKAAQLLQTYLSNAASSLRSVNPADKKFFKKYWAVCYGQRKKYSPDSGRIIFPLVELNVEGFQDFPNKNNRQNLTRKKVTSSLIITAPDNNSVFKNEFRQPVYYDPDAPKLSPKMWLNPSPAEDGKQGFIIPPQEFVAWDARFFPPTSLGRKLPAITEFTTLSSNRFYHLLELYPITGRKHQLRVHMASPLSQGTPIIGDYKYGRGIPPELLNEYFSENPQSLENKRNLENNKTKLHLHSKEITLIWPKNIYSFTPERLSDPFVRTKGSLYSKDFRERADFNAKEQAALQNPEPGPEEKVIKVTAPLPYHFQSTMDTLGLNIHPADPDTI